MRATRRPHSTKRTHKQHLAQPTSPRRRHQATPPMAAAMSATAPSAMPVIASALMPVEPVEESAPASLAEPTPPDAPDDGALAADPPADFADPLDFDDDLPPRVAVSGFDSLLLANAFVSSDTPVPWRHEALPPFTRVHVVPVTRTIAAAYGNCSCDSLTPDHIIRISANPSQCSGYIWVKPIRGWSGLVA